MYLYLSISVFVSMSVGRICHFFNSVKKEVVRIVTNTTLLKMVITMMVM